MQTHRMIKESMKDPDYPFGFGKGLRFQFGEDIWQMSVNRKGIRRFVDGKETANKNEKSVWTLRA